MERPTDGSSASVGSTPRRTTPLEILGRISLPEFIASFLRSPCRRCVCQL